MSHAWEQNDFFPDAYGGKQRKDEGMDRVAGHNPEWMTEAILFIHRLPHGWTGLPEDWRFEISKIIGEPTDEHAWGALTRELRRRGLIRKTGRRRPMRAPLSNYRETDEYYRP